MGGISIDKLVSDDGLRKLADKVMDETISIANADLISRNVDNAMLLGDAEVTNLFSFFARVLNEFDISRCFGVW